MARPRCEQFPQAKPCYLHVTSKCVRGAWLCGEDEDSNDWDHRKVWLRNQFQRIADCFAIHVDTYAIMSNHFHLLLKMAPSQIDDWSDLEVCQRWYKAFPSKVHALAQKAQISRTEALELIIQELLQDTARVAVLRTRLADLGWFMKAIKEPIARRCNQEENKIGIGAFWQGRYWCGWLKDELAIAACRVYIDSNPLRAGIAKTIASQQDTGITERLVAQKNARDHLMQMLEARRKAGPDIFAPSVTVFNLPDTDETGWLTPMRVEGTPISLDQYLKVLEQTSRHIQKDKAHKPGGLLLPDALDQVSEQILGLDANSWLQLVRTAGGSRRRRKAS